MILETQKAPQFDFELPESLKVLVSMYDVCKECKFCCTFDEEDGIWVHVNKQGKLIRASGVCPYFEDGKGCSFNETDRPIECLMYPFMVCSLGKFIGIELDPACPAVQKIPIENLFKVAQDLATALAEIDVSPFVQPFNGGVIMWVLKKFEYGKWEDFVPAFSYTPVFLEEVKAGKKIEGL